LHPQCERGEKKWRVFLNPQGPTPRELGSIKDLGKLEVTFKKKGGALKVERILRGPLPSQKRNKEVGIIPRTSCQKKSAPRSLLKKN